LLDADSRVDLSISNGMWNNTDVNIKETFTTNIMANYDATIQTLDFNDEAKTKKIINSWAFEKTKGNITDIFKDDNDISNSKFILCNTVYFNGKWTVPLKKELTQKNSFINIDNSHSNVETMVSEREGFLFCTTETADIIGLPYGNRAYSMYVILPKVKDNIRHEIQYNKFIDGIDFDWWEETKKDMNYSSYEVFIPKFKIETNCPNIGLTTLTELSSIIFSHNMKNMTDSEIGRLQINQYNTIEVSENGTTATSVSEISSGITSAFSSKFIVDRPFIFLIEEQSTGAILFMGKVVKL
ncbi:MAG: hypothetical protein K2G74_07970, partial [Muribaculaceae bacterium]|nr:hypothetical protein [Muribaculaceae bacterium]